MSNKSILIISDLHCPFNHQDSIAFLTAVKKKYNPDRVILTGDEADYAGISFHDHNPDMDAPGAELEATILALKPLYKLFPKAQILESNHGSLVLRKAMAHGLSTRYFRSYGEILEAPKGWTWHFDITLQLPDKTFCYFHHSKGVNAKKNSQAMGMSFVQGHHHETFELSFWGNPHSLLFGMTVGCLVNPKSLAMAYNKNNLKRPVLGCGYIKDSKPFLIPMVVDKHGRWVGYI